MKADLTAQDRLRKWVTEVNAAYADGGYAAGDNPMVDVDDLEEVLDEIERLRGALATVVNYYDMLPGEGQEDTPTDWQYVARVMRTIANEVNAPEEMHGT